MVVCRVAQDNKARANNASLLTGRTKSQLSPTYMGRMKPNSTKFAVELFSLQGKTPEGIVFTNQIQTEWVCYNYFALIVCEQIKGAPSCDQCK